MKDVLIAHPKTNEQADALKAFLKALKIDFEVSKAGDSPYNAEFTAKIEKNRKDLKEGKGKTVTLDDINNLWK